MPYLIGVHASLAEVSESGIGLRGRAESPFPLHPQVPSPASDPRTLSGGPPSLPSSQTVREKGLEDVVMMNVDSNILETPFDDMQSLPPDVVGVTPSHPPAVSKRRKLHTRLLSTAFLSSRCPC